ncbi:hypothetical protein [Embleya sp. NBC_00896]|uniref:hypothetical protein n=1 Tax=Embleya sp. NBC_00896 TaxID=2975961 RepID=UPI00386AD21E|nr:hypothetical protein OG928_04700 [Embleya sp. NBC_00896]
MTEVDYHLRSQVDHMNTLVVRLGEQVGVVAGEVAAVGHAQQQTRTELQQLRADFLAFVEQATLTANVQRAETKIGVIQDTVDHEYGHYKTVRRTAVGMLQAFDTGLVSEETVRSVGEQLMIQTPRYWLAPALIGLAAWSADDPTLCARAVEEAFRRAPDRTSLFFALVLRRQGRQPVAVRWLRHYLGAQDPAALGREFAVILESISQGAFGPAGRELLRETLDGWRDKLLADAAGEEAQITRWRAEIDSLRGPSTQAEFPRLAGVCPEWPQLDAVLAAARAQQAVLDKYTAMMAREDVPSDRIEDAVDDILDRLVSEYDNEELPLRRELALQQAVVDHDGDLAAARNAADVDAASLDETLDYLTVQTTAALNPAAIGASAATQRLSVAACHGWFTQAHEGFARDYRSALPQQVGAYFATSHGVGAQTFALPPWSGSFSEPLEHLEHSLGEHWDRQSKPFVDSLGFDWRRAALVPVAIVVGVLVLIGGFNIAFALVAALVVGGVAATVLYSRYHSAVARQDVARRTLEAAKQESIQHLRGARAELTDWQTRFEAADRVAGELRQMIAGLATAGHAATPYEGRTVSTEGTGS